jgi:hypothetical protein
MIESTPFAHYLLDNFKLMVLCCLPSSKNKVSSESVSKTSGTKTTADNAKVDLGRYINVDNTTAQEEVRTRIGVSVERLQGGNICI